MTLQQNLGISTAAKLSTPPPTPPHPYPSKAWLWYHVSGQPTEKYIEKYWCCQKTGLASYEDHQSHAPYLNSFFLFQVTDEVWRRGTKCSGIGESLSRFSQIKPTKKARSNLYLKV